MLVESVHNIRGRGNVASGKPVGSHVVTGDSVLIHSIDGVIPAEVKGVETFMVARVPRMPESDADAEFKVQQMGCGILLSYDASYDMSKGDIITGVGQ